MQAIPWIIEAGAAAAFITDTTDGDCGWDGWETGSRPGALERSPVPGDRLVAVRQCHGDRIVAASPADSGRGSGDRRGALDDADGLMTVHAGLPLGITVADCVPLFLCAPGAGALVHAGREGTALGIAYRAVRQLSAHAHVPVSALFAYIGPSAGPCCYEVPDELRTRCVARGMVAHGTALDLWASNQAQLRQAGIPDAHIRVAGHCTICQPGYFSHRGQATGQRNLAVLML